MDFETPDPLAMASDTRSDLNIVAVSERLNLEKAGVKTGDFGERVVFFKGLLNPKTVLELAETIGGTSK